MTELPITYRGTIYPWHCDHMNHMNVMWYAGKFDEATWHLLSLLGLTSSALREQNRGMVAVEQHTTYKRELISGDLITIRSGLLEMREKSVRFFHEMRNDKNGELAAVTRLTGVYIDAEARKACSFPEAVLTCGRGMIVDYVTSELRRLPRLATQTPASPASSSCSDA